MLPRGTELTATQLRDLLQGYVDGQPMDVLTSGWVLLEGGGRRFASIVIFCAIVAVILLILYFKE